MIEQLSNIVKEVGALLINWRDLKVFDGTWVGSQFKAKVDHMAHIAIVGRLKKVEPVVPIISEEDEGSLLENRPDTYWLIDPIDGTASFVNGYDGFVTQVALIRGGYPSLAAIYAPVSGSLYQAEHGRGAFLNGERLHLPLETKQEILIDNHSEPKGIARVIYNDLGFKKYIECGGISLKICKVADGTADVFFKNVIVRDWDIAAPQLVLKESGGVLRDCHGEKIMYAGGYSNNGLVAAATEETCLRIVYCVDNYIKKGTAL